MNNAENLATNLGFVPGKTIKEWSSKEYWRPTSDGKFVTLTFQNSKYGKGQAIDLRLKENTDTEDNIVEVELGLEKLFAAAMDKLGLPRDHNMFDTETLKAGGYEKLYFFLKELEAEYGSYEKFLMDVKEVKNLNLLVSRMEKVYENIKELLPPKE